MRQAQLAHLHFFRFLVAQVVPRVQGAIPKREKKKKEPMGERLVWGGAGIKDAVQRYNNCWPN